MGVRASWVGDGTLNSGARAVRTGHRSFKHEAFYGLCAETAIEAPDIPSFIEQAVAFVNNTLWGTLNAAIIVHPFSLRDLDIRPLSMPPSPACVMAQHR